jgi:hypothetical protein
VVVTPLGVQVSYGIEGLNDEPAHLNYVTYLAEHHSFPIQTESFRSQNATVHNVFEYYQPPLYYLLCVPGYFLGGKMGALYFGRILSFIFGIISLIVLIDILRLIKLNSKVLTLALTVASFQLSHVYFCSLLSNDSLSWLIGILIINCFLRKLIFKNKKRSGDIWIGVLLTSGMFIKSSLIIYFPVYLLMLLYDYYNGRRSALVQQLGILLGAIAVAAPWYIRNYILYKSIFAFEVGFGPAGVSCLHLGNIHTAINATVRCFFFPMQHVPVTTLFKLMNYLGVILITAHIGMISGHLFKFIRTDAVYRIAALIVGLAMLSYALLMTKWFNAEGRYLFPAFGPLMMLLFPVNIQTVLIWKYLKIIVGIEIVFGYLYFLLL